MLTSSSTSSRKKNHGQIPNHAKNRFTVPLLSSSSRTRTQPTVIKSFFLLLKFIFIALLVISWLIFCRNTILRDHDMFNLLDGSSDHDMFDSPNGSSASDNSTNNSTNNNNLTIQERNSFNDTLQKKVSVQNKLEQNHGTIDDTASTDDSKLPYAVIHVGPHKTGSTSLQKFILHNMNGALAMDNYRHPMPPNIDRIKNDAWFASCFHSPNEENVYHNRCHLRNRGRILSYYKSFINDTLKEGSNIIISSEELDRKGVNITELMSYFRPHYQIHIVLYYRRFYDWILSFHNQLAKMGYIHGAEGEKSQISFVEWLTFDVIESFRNIHSFDVYQRYRSHPAVSNVTVINLHQTGVNSLSAFFCDHLHGTANSCQKAKDTKMSKTNASKDLDWKIFLSKIETYYSINLELDENKIKKQKVKEKLNSMTDVPLVCLPMELKEKLLELSITFEVGLTPKWWQNSDEGLKDLEADFAKKITSKLCSMDVEKILKSTEWKDFLNQLLKDKS